MDLSAIDPAFEKAIRALGIIAQGVTGQPGGLDTHQERIDQALFLLNDVIDGDPSGTPPFGTENAGGLKDVESLIGFQQVTLSDSKTLHTHLAGPLDDRIAGSRTPIRRRRLPGCSTAHKVSKPPIRRSPACVG